MSGLAYHGPGLREDAHNLDPTAHGGLTSGFVASADTAGPEIIVPPCSVQIAQAQSAWPAANMLIGNRFQVGRRKAYRWANFYVGGTSAGNVQIGVASLRRTGTTVYATKVMDSGLIACPAASTPARIDLGATTLPPGDYIEFMWSDSTTAVLPQSLTTGQHSTRMCWTASSLATGLGSAETQLTPATRFLVGINLESDS